MIGARSRITNATSASGSAAGGSSGFSPPPGEVYQAIESPRGELGFFVASDGSANPYRVKVRAPSFVNLQALPNLVVGRLIADVVACIGTTDIVLGEVDR